MTIDVTPERASRAQPSTRSQRDVPPQRRASLVAAAAGRRSSVVRWVPVAALGVDLIALAVALLCAGVGRMTLPVFAPPTGDLGPTLVLVAPPVVAGWVLAILLAGGYAPQVFGSGTGEYRRVLNASLANVAVVGVACYLFKISLSRGWFVLLFLVGIPLLMMGRIWLRGWLRRERREGRLQNRVLVVGDEMHVEDVAAVLRRESWIGYDVIGAAAPINAGTETRSGIKILGDTSDLRGLAGEAKADVVVFAGGAVSSSAQLRTIAWELEHSDVQVVVAPSLTDVSSERVSVRPVGGLPLLHLEKPRAAAAARLGKRSFDAVGSALLIVMLSPVIAFASLQIWLHDRGPVLFKQERIGKDGVPFRCWKFRTMVTDAEALLAKIHDEQGSAKGVFVKIKDDPRVTTPGRWLRRLSLDELPQLVNVLRGDMSLVGPRPQVAHEVALYDSAMSRRLHVRPGMTGLWQVSGRSDLSLEEAIRLDLYYVDNWSMVQDLSILARTAGAVMASRGAY